MYEYGWEPCIPTANYHDDKEKHCSQQEHARIAFTDPFMNFIHSYFILRIIQSILLLSCCNY